MTSSFRFMQRDTFRPNWSGLRPGPIVSSVTGLRRSSVTNWPVWSPRSATAPRGFQLVSGCSALQTGIATARFGKGARLYMRGPWREGKPGLRYQLPLTPEQFFKAGLAAADAACRKRNGKAFSELDESGADRFLHEIASGKVKDERVQLASWFNELVYPLFEKACFADPIYGGNIGKVFWKAIGYPGLPAVHSQDMTDFRGKPFPGAADPKSIADFA